MQAAILNAGSGAWAFEALADDLSRAFGVPVANVPAAKNYLLAWDGPALPAKQCFVPPQSIEVATDKRLIARAFERFAVPRPATFLLGDNELEPFLWREEKRRWLLKFPTGCGGAGHCFLQTPKDVPADWPRPFVVQEFIEMARPEVFRLYGVAGELFGANARRFTEGSAPSPFVAHARGARYEAINDLPTQAVEVARLALEATGLLASFGCVDLLPDARGNWLALEVGTDGLWNHVDRDLGIGSIERELEWRLAQAFNDWAQSEATD